MNIKDEVYRVVAAQASVAVADLSDNLLLIDNLGMDSLDAVQVMMELEELFDLDPIDSKDMGTIEHGSIEDLIKFIEKQVNNR